MSGSIDNFSRISATGNDTAPIMYSFLSTTDAMATILASAYFNFLMQDLTNGVGIIKVNDILLIQGSDGDGFVKVTAVTTAVTVANFSAEFVNVTLSGNTIIGDAGTDTVTFNAKLVGQLYRNETGVDSKSLKMHNHDTAATMNNEFKYETINTSGNNYGTWNECHIAATGTATMRAQTNVTVLESTFTATDTTLIGTYSQCRGDGDIRGASFVAAQYALIEASAAITATHVTSSWLDSHQANAVTGQHDFQYMTNNGAAVMDQVTYIYGGNKITNWMAFDTVDGMISATAETGGSSKKIKILVDGVLHYINAYTG